MRREVRANLFLVATVALAQAPVPAPAFDVASIRPSEPNQVGGWARFLPGGRFEVHNSQLIFVIQQIYGLRDFQIVDAPKWITDAARYEIQAKGDDSASDAQVREMAKALLAERFQLKVHREIRDLPVYALIPAKGGVKLQAAKDDGKPPPPIVGRGYVSPIAAGWLQGNNVPMQSLILAFMQSRVVDRPVVDKTNFVEPFDFRLTWTPESDSGAEGGCPSNFAAIQEQLHLKGDPLSCPSIFTAVQDQLGLKLDPRKDPIEVLVIDHVERPSEN